MGSRRLAFNRTDDVKVHERMREQGALAIASSYRLPTVSDSQRTNDVRHQQGGRRPSLFQFRRPHDMPTIGRTTLSASFFCSSDSES